MKLAVLLQTSNTLIIDGALLGALSHCKQNQPMSQKRGKSDTEGSGEQRRRVQLYFFSSEQKKEEKKAFKQLKVVQCWGWEVISLNLS